MQDQQAKARSMTWPHGRKVGRKPAFDRADVIDAAFAEGVDQFTLAGVAKRLGVATPAIYRLFPSRDDLVVACLVSAGESIALPGARDPWQLVLQKWADECWRICEERRGLSRLAFAMPTIPALIEKTVAAYALALERSGKTRGQAMFALDFIGDTVFASHLGVEALRTRREDGTTGLDAMKAALDDAQESMEPNETWMGRSLVDIKVNFIISSLEANWPEF